MAAIAQDRPEPTPQQTTLERGADLRRGPRLPGGREVEDDIVATIGDHAGGADHELHPL